MNVTIYVISWRYIMFQRFGEQMTPLSDCIKMAAHLLCIPNFPVFFFCNNF